MRFKNFSVMNKFVVMQYVEELVVHIMFQTIFLQKRNLCMLSWNRHFNRNATITSRIKKLNVLKTLNGVYNDACQTHAHLGFYESSSHSYLPQWGHPSECIWHCRRRCPRRHQRPLVSLMKRYRYNRPEDCRPPIASSLKDIDHVVSQPRVINCDFVFGLQLKRQA